MSTGKPRADGVGNFLASRGIILPEGSPEDLSDAATIHTLSRRKNELFLRQLAELVVEVYPGSVRYLRAVKDAGLSTAVVTASTNATDVLAASGLADLIDVRIDGVVAACQGLRGKPRPTPSSPPRVSWVCDRRRPRSSKMRSLALPPDGRRFRIRRRCGSGRARGRPERARRRF